MEKKLQTVSHFFRGKISYPYNRNNSRQSAVSKQVVGSDVTVRGDDNNSIIDRLYQNINSLKEPTEMASIKLGWIIFNWIGIPIYLYTWFLAVWNVDETKQWTLLILSIIFGLVKTWHAFENARSKRIDNDERSYEIKRQHKRDDNQHQRQVKH